MKSTASSLQGLDAARSELQTLLQFIDVEIKLVSQTFVELAARTEQIMQLASSIVECAGDPQLHATLREAQSMGEMTQSFIAKRRAAMTHVLRLVDDEVGLIDNLSQVTLGQKKIARECDVLSLLTNIEVARLGETGNGFHYLAHELRNFSRFVSTDMQQMTRHVEGRRMDLVDLKERVAFELPRTEEEFNRIAVCLQGALDAIDGGLRQLQGVPTHFRSCVHALSQQIAGVVAAIQAQDITRQQLEHVGNGLCLIASMEEEMGNKQTRKFCNDESPSIGLTIQMYQMRSARASLSQWVSQIENCMGLILQLSAAELVNIAPLVLRQEEELTSRLACIESLESDCEVYGRSLQQTIAGLSSMTDLVREHLKESTAVRDRLQVLMFNSIIESSRLGREGDAILSISRNIRSIAAEWSHMTHRSQQVMDHMIELLEHSGKSLEIFSESAENKAQTAREQTGSSLKNLHEVMLSAAVDAAKLQQATEQLQSLIVGIGSRGRLFADAFTSIDAVLVRLEAFGMKYLPISSSGRTEDDVIKMESLFAGAYTTETERAVLRAAVRGDELPEPDQSLGGNDAELF